MTHVDRLRAEIETIAASESPSMTFTTENPYDHEWSACTTWFAPTDQLNLLSFSAPGSAREHSFNIESCADLGVIAKVSGGMREEGQVKNDPGCHGVSFRGEARRLIDSSEIDKAIGIFVTWGTFDEVNLDKYLHHGTDLIPVHGVYEFRVNRWTLFDGGLGGDNPDRLVRIDWPAQSEGQQLGTA